MDRKKKSSDDEYKETESTKARSSISTKRKSSKRLLRISSSEDEATQESLTNKGESVISKKPKGNIQQVLDDRGTEQDNANQNRKRKQLNERSNEVEKPKATPKKKFKKNTNVHQYPNEGIVTKDDEQGTSKRTTNQEEDDEEDDGRDTDDEELNSNAESYDGSESDTEEEIDEDEILISANNLVHDNMFQKELEKFIDRFDEWVQPQINNMLQGEQDDNSLLNTVTETVPHFNTCIYNLIKSTNKSRILLLNISHARSRAVSILYKMFVFFVKEMGNEYNYTKFFCDKKFNDILLKYMNHWCYERKRRYRPKIGVSSDGKTIVTSELHHQTIVVNLQDLYNMFKIFDIKISEDCKEMLLTICRSSIKELDIKTRRMYEDVEDLKWPFTPYDHNWILEKYPIIDKNGLAINTCLATMNYTGIRTKTTKAILLKDILVFQDGREVTQIILTLRDLKETSEDKKIFIPGNLIPIDVTGLLILYLDSRKVFEKGLDQEKPCYKIKKEFENEPLFVLPFEISSLYKELSKKLKAPYLAISARSSRKGHCIMHVLDTKTIYPAMPLQLLCEDLLSGGTWAFKSCMKRYLKGGCDQISQTCERIEEMIPPPPNLDANEHHLFLVDVLETISDWQLKDDDPEVTELKTKLLENGGKTNVVTTDCCRQFASAINFFKKVKAIEFSSSSLPKIAINVAPKAVNLLEEYRDGNDVFSSKSSICEICESVCIQEKLVIKNFDSTTYKADRAFYVKIKGSDDSTFEGEMAKQFAPSNENQQKCILKLFESWSLEK